MAYSKTCKQHVGYFWLTWFLIDLIDLIGEPIRCISRWHFSLSHVTCHSLRVFAIRGEDLYCKICAILFSLYSSVFRPLCLKINERRYLEVVSGSGKFIFAVSTGYLFGICCNLCASVFTWPRAIVCLSELSDSESELLCKKQKAKSLGFWVKWCQFIPFSEMVSNYM